MEGLGAAVPAMEDSRMIDASSVRERCGLNVSDADSAFLQSYLGRIGGTQTYVELLEDYWLPEWHGVYTNPCCLLVLSLYGHEDGGGFWKEKVTQILSHVDGSASAVGVEFL